MSSMSRVISMTATPAGRYVRLVLSDGDVVRMRPLEVTCRDIRVGDTISHLSDRHMPCVRLDLRPSEAVHFTC